MTDRDEDTVICQWCRHPIPAKKATWWNDKPQCPNPFTCARRTP